MGPQKLLKDWTAFSYLTSKTMQGPIVICSIIDGNSGRTPLYTSKNSSAVGLSSLNISIELISKPSYSIMSMTCPASPSWTMWGFITQQVQLLKAAVGPNALEKNKLDSFSISVTEAEAWIAFLKVSEPK
jgi:hypothetical protein